VVASVVAVTATLALPPVNRGLLIVTFWVVVAVPPDVNVTGAPPPITMFAALADAVRAPVSGQVTVDVMTPAVTAPPSAVTAVLLIAADAVNAVALRVADASTTDVLTPMSASPTTDAEAPLAAVPLAAGATISAVPPTTLTLKGAAATMLTSTASAVAVPPTTA
jgi:hypothetical protein